MYCNKCNIYNCSCSRAASKTIINSDQAGQDGLSAYDIAIRTGKFTGTEAEFVDWNKGEKGDPGITSIATTINIGLINQVEPSPDTATEAAGETPTKEEFDSLLAELRDLKTKMRAGDAPILSS